MLSDLKTSQTECLFLLIDNDIIEGNTFELLMTNLMKNEYDCYIYLQWLLTRWVYLRKNKFQIPEKKKKDVFCTNCGSCVLISHQYCGYCGTRKFDKNIKSFLI